MDSSSGEVWQNANFPSFLMQPKISQFLRAGHMNPLRLTIDLKPTFIKVANIGGFHLLRNGLQCRCTPHLDRFIGTTVNAGAGV